MRYAICSSDPETIAASREAGFDYVEAWAPNLTRPGESEAAFEDAADAFARGGLPVEAVNGFLVHSLVCIGPEADHGKIAAYADEVLGRAAKVGVKTCVFGSGWARCIPEGWPREKAVEQFEQLLVRLAPVASSHGIRIAVEPLRFSECNLVNTVEEAASFAERVASPAIGALVDFFHWSANSEPESSILAAGKCMFHTHVATSPTRKAPSLEPSDFSAFFRALRAIGYDGRMSVEADFLPEPGPNRVEEFRAVLSTLRSAEAAV